MIEAAAAPARAVHRPELQGLRALAVGLVVVYHVWLNRVSGGVDVFFVLTGFLLTGQLVRAVERGGIDYRAQWGRLLQRLVPTSAVVLAVTAMAAMALLPADRWFQTIRELVAALLFLENWQLAADSVDYYAQNNTASVVQHFWSLSIQGQFSLLWPVFLGLLALIATQNGRHLRRYLTGSLAVVGAASLLYSIALTAQDQPLAYFHSLTRLWEFTLGGLIAVAGNRFSWHRTVRVGTGWLGVMGLLSCGLVLDAGAAFPGWAALWPTLSAALVLLAGQSGSPFGADRVLSWRWLTWLGDHSFTLYLWHWPVLVLYLVHQGRTEVGWLAGAGIIALSLALAVLTRRWVEEPVRRRRLPGRATALLMLPVLLLAGAWQLAGLRALAAIERVGDPEHPGALANGPVPASDLLPPRIALAEDWASTAELDCTRSDRNQDLEMCVSATEGDPARRIVLIGDSHIQQYLAAVLPQARERNWQITAMLKGVCPFSTEADAMPGDQPCIDWNAAAAEEIIDQHPDAVLTLASRDVRPGRTEHTPPGFLAQWQRLAEHGIAVLAVRDNPRFDFSPALCAFDHGPTAPECTTPRADLLTTEPPYAGLDGVPETVRFLDLSDYYCPGDNCPPAVGNVLVYMDDNHLTASFMSTLATVVGRELAELFG